ncbi:COG4223 family protein [Devosia faecipullorum]|uniref:COG4223 family protein n=1 Tax=Devosia faecipullorum TaxID=2755039 RepID=UPI00187B4E84|nr:hypothetical protein [Devosia faecipullorum]MBE7732694.1 hypothetical protein [Devosia faecipullorum]
MADNPGKQTPSTDPKSPDKTGPVRPPVLEGTARTAAGDKPAEKPAPSRPEAPKPSPNTKPNSPEPTSGTGAPWLAGLVGGALGLGAAYGLAWFGLWPSVSQSPPPADPRLAQFATAIPELQSRSGSVENTLSSLTTRLTAIEAELAAIPSGNTDSNLADEVTALSARLDMLAARPTETTDTAAQADNAEALAALEAQISQLRQTSSEATARLSDAESRIAALASAAEQATDDAPARLPLILTGLDQAFAAGRAYQTELTALRTIWHEAPVPQAIVASADKGLPRPDDVARRLNAAIPDILAGRPADSAASWQDGAMDWLRGVIAIRPTEDIEGDSPEALVARLEAAIARRDFSAAHNTLTALPASMRDAAGAIAADIALLADAELFLLDLRRAALGPEGSL